MNNTVVGARFANEKSPKHVITHYVSSELLANTIENLKSCIHLISEEFGDSITYEAINNLKENDIDYSRYNIAKTTFRNIVVDSHYLDRFSIPDNSVNTRNQSIITIYKTNIDLVNLMKQIGVDVQPDKIISETTLFFTPMKLYC